MLLRIHNLPDQEMNCGLAEGHNYILAYDSKGAVLAIDI
jgi:hypothetical protein